MVYFTLLVLWLATIVAGQCLDVEENEAVRKDRESLLVTESGVDMWQGGNKRSRKRD